MTNRPGKAERQAISYRLIQRGVGDLAFTIPEVVILSKICRSAIDEDVKSGALPARKRGITTIVLAEDLVAYLHNLPDAVAEGT